MQRIWRYPHSKYRPREPVSKARADYLAGKGGSAARDGAKTMGLMRVMRVLRVISVTPFATSRRVHTIAKLIRSASGVQAASTQLTVENF